MFSRGAFAKTSSRVSINGLKELLPARKLATLDLFDRVQLEAVIGICRRSSSLAEAGRKLFAATRTQRSSVNDSHRLRKYLARFDLEWARLGGRSL